MIGFDGENGASQLVATFHPIVPIVDRFTRLVVHVNPLQLRQGSPQCTVLPSDEHEHLVLALIFPSHAGHLYLFTLPKW
jgi:hypothetical protein